VTVAVNFLILAGVIVVMVRQINRLKRRQTPEASLRPAAPEVPEQVQLREIRDNLQTPR
jgi:large conductance mechanosensitive channel